MPDYAAHEAVYFSQAITADDFAMKKNPKYVNKVVAPTLEPISSIGGFRNKPPAGFSLGAFDLCTYKKQKESDIGAYTIKQTTDYYKTILRA